MAQFRNTVDILNEVLQKSGEPTNGNSPFQTIALTYLNKAHHAIIGGGSFLNVNVDEPWVWARAHFPMVIELQPAFTNGYITAIQGSNNIALSVSPTNPYTGSASSIEGWHLQALGLSSVYKIMSHTAGSTVAQLDSSFVDTTGTYSFRAFQIDYPIFPTYMYVDSSNDRLDFGEVGTAATTSLTAVVQHGSYTPLNLAATIAAQLNATGTFAYGMSYDTVANTFFLTANGTFVMRAASGSNARRTTLPLLGFDQLDYTGAASYTSTYLPNQVARMIEPFKMFMVNWWGEHFCYSTDPIKMQEDYPLARITSRFPDRFCRISEDNNGVIWVRFNAYPVQLTKLQIDWVAQPIDLQNNTASFTRLPRGDVDTLIHAASAMVLYDKNDSKWETTLKLSSSGLDAMKKKNHDLLLRTGQEFAQIVPRQDLNRAVRKLNFGYTVNGGSTAVQTPGGGVTYMVQVPLTYANFQANAQTVSYTAAQIMNNVTLFALIVQLTQTFTGSGITAATLNVGTLTNPTQFINGFNLAQGTSAAAQASNLLLYYPAIQTPIITQVIVGGSAAQNFKVGAFNLFLQETQVP